MGCICGCFGEYLNVFAWLICGFCLFFAVGFVGCVFGFLEKSMLYWRGDRKKFLCQKR